ncbi:MAG: hypothetical protein KA020_09070 [Planctomycetes bacterium]|nr:hypothetical protein [Planctomycetota bacterium]
MRIIPSLARLVMPLLLGAAVSAQAAWQIAYPAQSPQPDYQWAAAFDEVRGEALLMFPRSGQAPRGWRWNGTTWSPLNGPLPADRLDASMVWDAGRQRAVLFGGIWWGGPWQGALHEDLWEWDGSTWSQSPLPPSAMPPARNAPAFAYDRARGLAVLFGGYNRDDTWEWNGVAWTQRTPAVHPTAREQSAMAFDPSTQRLLLYGGFGPVAGNQVRFVETWTWDGVVWQQHYPSAPPFVRDRPSMVADLARSRVVLHGGSTYDYSTWEWDGAQWHQSNPSSPGALRFAGCFYDTQRREVVVHGGDPFGVSVNQTWIYRTASPASVVSFGSGCAGSFGVPQLMNKQYSNPWLGDTLTMRTTNLSPSVGAVIFVSNLFPSVPLDLAGFGMPGCTSLVNAAGGPVATDFRVASSGAANWMLGVPNTASFVGVRVYQQAFALEPGANAAGLVASNGAELTLGIR